MAILLRSGRVKKLVAAIIVLGGLAAAGLLADQAVERDREYRRLIVQGDEALGRGQTFVAIEFYSGATVILQGCGHWTGEERPEEVNKALLAFLSDVN